jgi:hypothetical protein
LLADCDDTGAGGRFAVHADAAAGGRAVNCRTHAGGGADDAEVVGRLAPDTDTAAADADDADGAARAGAVDAEAGVRLTLHAGAATALAMYTDTAAVAVRLGVQSGIAHALDGCAVARIYSSNADPGRCRGFPVDADTSKSGPVDTRCART